MLGVCGAEPPRLPQELDVDPSLTTTPPGPGAATRPPLRRPRDGRVLAGVAAGLADHLGLDVALVRLLIVLATIITQGFGLLVYLVAIFVIPAAEPGAPRPVAARRDPALGGRSPAFWGGIALLAVGLWWLVAVTPVRFGFLPGVSLGSLAAPLLLIGLGLALWVTGARAGTAAPPAAGTSPAIPPMPGRAAASAATPARPAPLSTFPLTPNLQEPVMTSYDTPTSGAETTSVPPSTTPPSATPPTPPAPPAGDDDGWTPPPAPERSSGLLSRATVGVLLVTVGILWSLRLAGVLAITGAQLLAAALLVVGLGLLVGAFAGRARGLIWVGAILLPLVLLAQLPGAGWIQSIPSVSTGSGTAAGELRLAPTELDDLDDSYEIGAGSIRLDLTQLPLDGDDVELEISVGAGEIRVIVPDDVDLDASASIGIGEIRLLERRSGGIGVGDLEVSYDAAGQAAGSIGLELSAGIGGIRVEQAPATRP
jgi:phage shock protein PspC (stress-responsive transcriptional regulator)